MVKKIFIGGLALVCILIGIFIYNKETYVGELVDPLTYFDEFENNTNNLVYEDKRVDLTEPVLIKDGQLFVRYDFANGYVNDIVFYDNAEKVMTLTNSREIIHLYEGPNEITYAGVKGTYTLLTNENGLYISANLLEDLFGVRFEEGREGKLYIATDLSKEQHVALIKKKASLRTHPQDKSTVVEKLNKNSKVYIYDEEDGYLRVRSEDGIIGYIKSADIKDETTQAAISLPTTESWKENPLGEKVRLVWDQMTTKVEVNWSSQKYKNVQKANVISPTWFEFGDAEGNLINRATSSYVQAAHNRGLEVWPILSHNFEDTGLTAKVLTSTAKRQYIIDQVIKYAKEYGFDGINIDIENIQTDTSAVWVQFMRELYPQLKNEGIKVSVDVYMPSSWSGHYEREKVVKCCDYFIVMGYDQHWSGSEEAGSVSELPWVEQGINTSLEEIPANKLVLGIPFYTRRWIETSSGLNSKSYGMASAKQLVNEWGVQPVLDEASGQYYAETTKADGVYKIWIEDYTSISKRIDLIEKYNLAGFGAWKLGLETDDIWQALERVK